MRYLHMHGMNLDLEAMQDYLKTYGPEAGETEKDRAELLRDLQEIRGSAAHERKKFRIRYRR